MYQYSLQRAATCEQCKYSGVNIYGASVGFLHKTDLNAWIWTRKEKEHDNNWVHHNFI